MDWVSFGMACYGSGLSTALALWQAKKWRDRVRGRVKVIIKDRMTACSRAGRATGPYIIFSAVNDGTKPVTLTGLYLAVKGATKELWLQSKNLPAAVTEGQEVSELIERTELLKTLGELGVPSPWTCTVTFGSNTGRAYRKRFRLEP